ncbi:uncharacterized protein TNCV_4339761 [Trichonephila clavipes]|nr:uncharacterized protein TNCV_4339761 [Trichonephila clavipes]
MGFGRVLRHISPVWCLAMSRSRVPVNAPLIRPNSWAIQLAELYDPRYAQSGTNLMIKLARKECKCGGGSPVKHSMCVGVGFLVEKWLLGVGMVILSEKGRFLNRFESLKEASWANQRIAHQMGRSDKAIRRCWQEHVDNGRFLCHDDSGRYRATSDREVRLIARSAVTAPDSS